MSGAADDWAYEHLGVFAWTTEFWDVVHAATGTKQSTHFWYLGPTDDEALAVLRWADEHAPRRQFVDWYPFEHPQLGAGRARRLERPGVVDEPAADRLHGRGRRRTPSSPSPRRWLAAASRSATSRRRPRRRHVADRGRHRQHRLAADARDRAGGQERTSSGRSWPSSSAPTASSRRSVGTPARGARPARRSRRRRRFTPGRDGTPDRRLVTWVVRAAAGAEVTVAVRHDRAGMRPARRSS